MKLLAWLLTRQIAATRNVDRALRSRFMWGQLPGDAELGIWRLRVLGVLNGPWMRGRWLAISYDDAGTPVKLVRLPAG